MKADDVKLIRVPIQKFVVKFKDDITPLEEFLKGGTAPRSLSPTLINLTRTPWFIEIKRLRDELKKQHAKIDPETDQENVAEIQKMMQELNANYNALTNHSDIVKKEIRMNIAYFMSLSSAFLIDVLNREPPHTLLETAVQDFQTHFDKAQTGEAKLFALRQLEISFEMIKSFASVEPNVWVTGGLREIPYTGSEDFKNAWDYAKTVVLDKIQNSTPEVQQLLVPAALNTPNYKKLYGIEYSRKALLHGHLDQSKLKQQGQKIKSPSLFGKKESALPNSVKTLKKWMTEINAVNKIQSTFDPAKRGRKANAKRFVPEQKSGQFHK